ncbi:MBL fold metallo-hydrolase [Pseudomonas sp. KNUC1026]|uniref:MBL fold metallo-hydrolase n=1 Tax=Pseudomonas sp. KNUC1026 TaxID=2893890 RepID=UPI001F347703|nr:MBL fold metallo-hydrolase [Pseudomonas sp. KNUC1026]UFH51709.1 MBL fold metallo-hydrolase [Pseudomonas sp. KNUC1026]
MQDPHITHHGAHLGVTGSCHQLHLAHGRSLLIDCGSYQGAEQSFEEAFAFDARQVVALVITHVHLDHVGRIPQLFAAGFSGPILCSEPSARLLPLMLEDAWKLAYGADPQRLARFLALLAERVVPLRFGAHHEVSEGGLWLARLRFERAGHVLGSAWVECELGLGAPGEGKRVLFSGDLGAGDSPLVRPPALPGPADTLVLESTYGDRLHTCRAERQRALEVAIEQALADQGTLLIPSFSLGRAQELLFELSQILQCKSLVAQGSGAHPLNWPQLPVILDSPLASRITQAYRDLQAYWPEQSQEGQALQFPQMITLDNHEQHVHVVNYLASTVRPAIVIAGNGMCSGGRIVNYLKRMLPDPRHNVLFTGYQAKGTPGALLQAAEGAEGFIAVDLDGERLTVRARVQTISGYSAHADQAGLVAFAQAVGPELRRVRLVHGEARAKTALTRCLREGLADEVVIEY